MSAFSSTGSHRQPRCSKSPRAAEQAGAPSLWFAQHMGYRDAIVWASAAASVTRTATLIPVAITASISGRRFRLTMALSTLAEFGARAPQSCQSRIGRQHPQSRRIRHRAGEACSHHARICRGAAGAVDRHAGRARRRAARAARRQDGVRPRRAHIRSMSPRPARRCSSSLARSATGCCFRPASRSRRARQCLDHAEAGVQAKGRDPAR